MDCGGVYLLEPDGGVRLVFHQGVSESYVEAVAHYGPDTHQATMVRKGEPIFLDFEAYGDESHPANREGLRSGAVLPTHGDGRVVGCLNLASRTRTEVPQEAGQVLAFLAGTIGRIIERERAIAALKDSEENLNTFFCTISEYLFVLDEQARIRRVNDAVLERLGYAAEDLIGRSVLAVHPEERRDEALRIVTDMLAGERDVCPIPLETRDGELIPVETRVTRGTWNGAPAIFGVSRDVSERVAAEKRQRALERRLHQAQKLESLSVLAGGVAHDFNNILMAVSANASLVLEDMAAADPNHEPVQDILVASQRAGELCKQMLAYSGRGTFVVGPFNLLDLVQDMSGLLRSSVSRKAEIALYLTHDLPLIQGDATQLRQVLLNLVVNASEALDDLGGTIALSAGVVDCSAEDLAGMVNGEDLAPGEYVFLQVSDTGCGMDAATRARLFDPFFTTKFTGRGLGLSAVLGIIRSHRGALSVRSEPGHGTEFRVLLPSAGVGAVLDDEPRPGLADLDADRCVLLVDDEREVRNSTRRLLERLGLRVITASDGQEALDIHAARAEEIDLVILDMTMPRLDGLETMAVLHERDPELSVILSSGYTEKEIRERCGGCEPVGFLQKPYDLQTLRETLMRFLRVWERDSLG
ncbi:response regulator, partial [bacterium]|nr:response regulator [bacterium]